MSFHEHIRYTNSPIRECETIHIIANIYPYVFRRNINDKLFRVVLPKVPPFHTLKRSRAHGRVRPRWHTERVHCKPTPTRVTCLLGRVTQAGVFSCVRHVRPLPPLFVWSLLLLLRLHCCRCTRTLTSVRRSHNNSTRANAHSHSCVHTVARLHLVEWVLFCISCACVFCYQLQNQTGCHPIASRAVSCLSRYQCSSCVRACTDWPVRVCARQCVICNK